LKIYQHTKFHGPTLTGASFASTSEVWTSAILEGWRYGIKKYGVEVTFNGMTSLLNFIQIYQLVQKLLAGDTQTDRQTGALISLTFLFKESRLKKDFDFIFYQEMFSITYKNSDQKCNVNSGHYSKENDLGVRLLPLLKCLRGHK
jgi:hypothetical protein